MFDHDAIELLIRTVQAAGGVQEINDTTIVTPNGVSVQSIEQHLPQRARYRGRYATDSMTDFAEYVGWRAGATDQPTSVYVDASTLSAKAYFNLGTIEVPGHGDDTGTLALKSTAGYTALGKLPADFSQKALAEWIEDWAHALSFVYAADPEAERTNLSQVLAAVRSVQITAGSTSTSEVHDLGAKRSRLEEIEAKAKDSTLTLPSALRFRFKPAEDLPEYVIDLRLSLSQADGAPKFQLRPVGLDRIREQIAQDFVAALKNTLDEPLDLQAVQLFRGTYAP